jgi:signal transduction histidine kinase
MSSLFDRVEGLISASSFGHRHQINSRRLGPTVLVGIIVLIGIVDCLTGPLWSMSVFYLIPTALGTVISGRRLGFVLTALSGASGLLSDVVLQPSYHHRAVAAWNVLFMVVTLMIVVELVHRSRQRAVDALQVEENSRQFLAAAAHQLRTPLAGIRSTTDALMMAPDLDIEQQELLAALVREADRGGRLVRSLLRVARLDQHEALPLETTDLGLLLQDESIRASSAWPQLDWSCQTPDVPVLARCSAAALSEAVANLLDNAHRHARTRIVVTLSEHGGHAEIVVNDDGPGLSSSSVATAFERFVSLDGQGGSGLGLPIAEGIAHAHGGILEYRDGAFLLRVPTRMPSRGWVPDPAGKVTSA